MYVRRSVGLIPLPSRDLGRAESWSPWTKSLPGKFTDMCRNRMRGHFLPCSNINIVDTAFQWYMRGRVGSSCPVLHVGWGQLLRSVEIWGCKSWPATDLALPWYEVWQQRMDRCIRFLLLTQSLHVIFRNTDCILTDPPLTHSCWTHPCSCRRPGSKGAVFYLLHPTTWWCRTIRYISLCASEQHTADPKLSPSAPQQERIGLSGAARSGSRCLTPSEGTALLSGGKLPLLSTSSDHTWICSQWY